ncbi:hypothetical protein SS1G_10789 [Sclerotinia sclerotiorum 1980 UF-70]|uniref:Uncharacterized protein n=1 Tax=Sclerotinia sclerotiorum (strain ATCC 18683 / 1980 / Ss-1) TaxID=665079 RepID=A7EZM2_SCLS1|nr:hypothetical protein SS1G_10789 [Sclerotinia sclerotiorum 1980 UF-70]EDN94914.1 hypothetical protein SS1G_10789 [Sclerotinia sclerotiorum 1980 UF-70]
MVGWVTCPALKTGPSTIFRVYQRKKVIKQANTAHA